MQQAFALVVLDLQRADAGTQTVGLPPVAGVGAPPATVYSANLMLEEPALMTSRAWVMGASAWFVLFMVESSL